MNTENCKKIRSCITTMHDLIDGMMDDDNYSKNNINIVMANKIIEELSKLEKKYASNTCFLILFFYILYRKKQFNGKGKKILQILLW